MTNKGERRESLGGKYGEEIMIGRKNREKGRWMVTEGTEKGWLMDEEGGR